MARPTIGSSNFRAQNCVQLST